MLRLIEKKWNDNELCFVISGDLNEASNFHDVIGVPVPKLALDLRSVRTVSSAGLLVWMKFAESCDRSGIHVRYVDCSPATVNHLPSIIPRSNTSRVASVMAPFKCMKCKISFENPVQTTDILAIKPQIRGAVCPQCKGPAAFDEIPEEYFSFLA